MSDEENLTGVCDDCDDWSPCLTTVYRDDKRYHVCERCWRETHGYEDDYDDNYDGDYDDAGCKEDVG